MICTSDLKTCCVNSRAVNYAWSLVSRLILGATYNLSNGSFQWVGMKKGGWGEADNLSPLSPACHFSGPALEMAFN